MFINNILGTSSKIKILRTLTETNTAFTIKELEIETVLSRGIIHKEVTNLTKQNIINRLNSKGKEKAYRINLEDQYSQKIQEIFSLEKIKERNNKIILKIWNLLESIIEIIAAKNIKTSSVFLFGSHAAGLATPKSDIDILIITEESNQKNIDSILRRFQEKTGIKINPVYLTKKRYDLEQKETSHLIEEINKTGIEL